jgi:hypothetical protein
MQQGYLSIYSILYILFSNKGDTAFLNQIDINIDELPVEKMIDSNHGGTV